MTRTIPRRIRQVLVARHPGQAVQIEDMAIEDVDYRPAPGRVVTRTTHISVDPYLAFNMSKARADRAPTPYPMRSRTIGEVVEPGDSPFRVGDAVLGFGFWQEFDDRTAAELRRVELSLAPAAAHLGVLGHSGFTAWLGLSLGNLRTGETLLISGATGAVGSTAGILARRMGCRVIGIAGGEEKVRWLTEGLGFHAGIDYRAPDFAAALGRAAPDGYDMLFENVGARTLDPALLHLKPGSRVMLCGLIQHYQDDAPVVLANFRQILRKSIRILPFSIYDHEAKVDQAMPVLLEAWKAGDLGNQHTLSRGFDALPGALVAMMRGQGKGKHVVQV